MSVKLSQYLTTEENREIVVENIEEFLKKAFMSQGEECKFKVKTMDVKPTKVTMVFSLSAPLFLPSIQAEIESEKEYDSGEAIFIDIFKQIASVLDRDPLISSVMEIIKLSKVEFKRKYYILKDKGPCLLIKINDKRIVVDNSANFKNKKEMFDHIKETVKIPNVELNVDACVVFTEEFNSEKASGRFVQLRQEISENILLNKKITFDLMKEFATEYFKSSIEIASLNNRKKLYSKLLEFVDESTLPNNVNNIKKINSLKNVINNFKLPKADNFTIEMVIKNLNYHSNPLVIERNDLNKFITNMASNMNQAGVEKVAPYLEKIKVFNKNLFEEKDKTLKAIFNKVGYNCIVSYIDIIGNKMLLKYAKKNSLATQAREIDLNNQKQCLSEILNDILKNPA